MNSSPNAANDIMIIMTTLTITESSSQDSMFSFEIGSPLFYIVVGAGSVMTLLISIIVFLLLCMLYNHYSHHTMHGKLHTILY